MRFFIWVNEIKSKRWRANARFRGGGVVVGSGYKSHIFTPFDGIVLPISSHLVLQRVHIYTYIVTSQYHHTKLHPSTIFLPMSDSPDNLPSLPAPLSHNTHSPPSLKLFHTRTPSQLSRTPHLISHHLASSLLSIYLIMHLFFQILILKVIVFV